MTTVAGTVWPVATRERIVEIWKPDASSPEAPFRTLRRRGWTSPGSIVHRHENGRLSGSVALFSSLNLDAASFARRGDGDTAERFAAQAAVVEQSKIFQRLLAHLAIVDPSVVPGVVAGVESVADDRARALLTDLALHTEDVREQLVGRATHDEAHADGAAAKVGRVTESTGNLVVVTFDTNAALAQAPVEQIGLPRTLAQAVNRDAPGDFLALLSRQVAPDRIDLKVLPALGLDAAESRPFSPFDRNDPRMTRLSARDAARLRGTEPAPLQITFPVVIEE